MISTGKVERPDRICLIKHDHFRTHSHETNPIFSGHYQNLCGLSLSQRYIYKFQIFHFFPDNFPNLGWRSGFLLIFVTIAINLVLSKQHGRRRKTVTMNKNGREQLSNRRQRTPRPDRRRGSRPTSARRPTC